MDYWPCEKVPSKVVSDIKKAIDSGNKVTTHDIITGQGLPYIPGTALLAAIHKGKVAYIRAATQRHTKDEEVVVVPFEDESEKFDLESKHKFGFLEHIEEYQHLGHPYICDYSLKPSVTWVQTMSPQVAHIFGKAEYICR
uniref:Uncharacterized protein n=1 Tax=Amphimedon queenslandica TaxID=400682 RepID=A0A1X7UDZ1_AMPQE